MPLRRLVKERLLAAVAALTGRHAVLLPREAGREDALLSVRAPYRVAGNVVRVAIAERASGQLDVRVLGYDGHFPTRLLGAGRAAYDGPSELTLDLRRGDLALGGAALTRVAVPIEGRRLALDLTLSAPGVRRVRRTGHYLPGAGNAGYFTGGTYVDYEAQAAGEAARVRALVAAHGAAGPVLEVGCATGLVLEALAGDGHRVVGVDVSPWAVERATGRLGQGRAFVCDVEADPLPPAVAAQGPFGAIVLWAVLEHFHRPFEVLAKLAAHAAPGARLFVNTSNADSLTRFLFGDDWEGHFDPSHHGVAQVSVRRLRDELPRLGFDVVSLTTEAVWDGSADPSHATLRDVWASDARFRKLLEERDAGDFITCVAVKR